MTTHNVSGVGSGPLFQFSGVASGLDTKGIIKALVSVARAPITQLQNKKSLAATHLATLSDISTKLSTMRSAAKALDTASEFQVTKASSSDTTAIVATAGSGASIGSFAINVTKLAQEERSYSAVFSDKDKTGLVGTGTLTITVGSGTAVNVSIDQSTDTLEGVASKINSSGADVVASIVYTGSGYQLRIAGKNTGASNSITFAQSGSLALNMVEQQAAQDASFTMDGLTFTRSSNTVTDLIPGVTLDLKKTTSSAVTVTVETDKDGIEKKVKALVDAYNAVLTAINKQSKKVGKQANLRLLSGDAALRSVKSRLQSILTGSVAAITTEYNALSRVGITTNRDGTMKLDSSKFQAALSADLKSVTDLFAYTDKDSATDNDGVAVRLDRAIELMVRAGDGIIAARKDGINRSNRQIDREIARLEKGVATYKKGLERQFAALEALISSFNSQGQFLSAVSTYAASARTTSRTSTTRR